MTNSSETTSAATRIDAQLAALRAALRRDDRSAASEHLRSIDTALAGISNPLVRGLAYASVQAELGKPKAAVRVVEDLLEVVGDDAFTYHRLGRHRRQAGDAEGAVAAFARACEIDPERVEAWLDLGILLDERAQPEAAMDCYREALRRAPMDFDVWRNLGNSLAALRRFEEAIAAYETALGQRPDDRTVLLLRAAAHQAKGDVDQANALTPADLRASMGEVVEVRDETARPPLACRFRSPPEQRDARACAASALLAQVRRERPALDDGVGDSPWVLVRQDALVLVCDPDRRRAGQPNRFFDATELVATAVSGPR